MFEILGKTNIDFMGKRTISFALSGIRAFLGIIAVFQIARGAANLGIDFAGGTAVQLKFDQSIRIDEARRALESNGVGSAELQEFTQDNKLLIRVKASTTKPHEPDVIPHAVYVVQHRRWLEPHERCLIQDVGRMWYHLRGMLPSNSGLWYATRGKWIRFCARWIGTGHDLHRMPPL